MLGNFPTPTMDFLIRWHQKPMGLQFLTPDGQLNPQLLERTGAPYKYGIHCIEVGGQGCLEWCLLCGVCLARARQRLKPGCRRANVNTTKKCFRNNRPRTHDVTS